MWRLAVISLAAASVASCGTLPKGAAGPAVPTARIVEAVRCQLAIGFADGNADPAGLRDWKVLTTITINGNTDYAIRPGIAGVAGKSGKATWKAPSSGLDFVDVTRREVKSEYKVRSISEAIAAPCPDPDAPTAAQGLDIGSWLIYLTAGQPSQSSGAAPLYASYKKTYTVTASAGGGLTFEFSNFSVKLEGNTASASHIYTIDVKLGPPAGPNRPFEAFGADGEDEVSFDDLRALRDEEDEEDTIIKVPPGQSIIIGP